MLRRRTASIASVLSLAHVLGGCPSPATPPDADAASDTVLDAAPDASPPSPACNPLGFGDPCVAPFPSAYYEVEDPSRASGVRVALTAEALPMSRGTVALDPAPFDRTDGFSPAGPILVVFPERIDPASLVPVEDIARSLDANASTVLVDMTSGERVAHFAEVDATAGASQRQSVIMRPARRLLAGHRYAVGVTRAMHTFTGAEPSTPLGFAAIRDGAPERDVRLATVAPRYPAIFDALARVGVARTDLLVAWDFVTASDETLTAPVLSMRDTALAMVGTDGLGLTVTAVEDDFDASILRRVRGTFRVPVFLDDPASPDAHLARDAQGHPMNTGVVDVPFVAMIPRVAATSTGPLPMLMIGHGLFGGAEHEFGDATSPLEHLQRVANEDGFVIFGTDWTGLTASDLSRVVEALGNFNLMSRTTDHLQQSLVNAMVLFRTARARFPLDPAFSVGGRVVVDPARTYFYGMSLGAIMGTSFMGYDPDCDRAVLNVFGGVWSTLFQRSDGWSALRLALSAYPRSTDQQVLLALAQSLFDPADPINLAPHLLADRLAGVPPRVLLFQQAVGDSAVTNVASEIVARTVGVTLVTPSPRIPYGAPQSMAPLASGWTIVDEMPTPPPPSANLPASNNPTHTHVRTLPVIREQFRRFMRPDGVVEQTCDGACDPN